MRDVVILDVSLALLNGIDAARVDKERPTKSKIMFVTMHSSASYLQAALAAGASAARDEELGALRNVIRNVFEVVFWRCIQDLAIGGRLKRRRSGLRASHGVSDRT